MAEVIERGPLPFVKMSGSGNDFIIMDNRNGLLRGVDFPQLARRVCARHTSVGADGLIVIEESVRADFKWQFFNSDGSAAEMCGNGGRCAARYASMESIAGTAMKFETGAGIVSALVGGSIVKVQLTSPSGYEENIPLKIDGQDFIVSYANTGVPHVVILTEKIDSVDLIGIGRTIRNHPRFQPAGTNVNFVEVESPEIIKIRTYERGVEGETMACGTGSVASVLITWKKGLVQGAVNVKTSGGEILKVYIDPVETKEYPDVFLEGKTTMICRGVIDPEAYE